ncbi:transcriptional regulator swi6 [Rhizophlyctis rosea]|uniref:Transcriptional regulator swi6 n=1 Tax=Rhizophlyctis rosea TaxID=64517 RepID=A0AAD5SMX0_9FUNG|nr:transcriptional regulator swi6 [Rhizophlyctis rosea]
MAVNIDFARKLELDIPDSPTPSSSSFDENPVDGPNSVGNPSDPVNDSNGIEQPNVTTLVPSGPFPPCRLAVYRNISVNEFIHRGTAVMRRVQDGWVNVTNMLKAGGFDQDKRDDIIKREIMWDESGVRKRFEKVRVGEKGRGHLAIDGIWAPFEDARALATRHNIVHQMDPIFRSETVPVPQGDAYSEAINTGRLADVSKMITDCAAALETEEQDGSSSSDEMSGGSETGAKGTQDLNVDVGSEMDIKDSEDAVTADAKQSDDPATTSVDRNKRGDSPTVRQRAQRLNSPSTDTSNSGDETPPHVRRNYTKRNGVGSQPIRRSPRLNNANHSDPADPSLVPHSPLVNAPSPEVPTFDCHSSDSPPASVSSDESQEGTITEKAHHAPSTPTSSICSGTTINGNASTFALPAPATTTKPASYPFLTITDSHLPLPDIASGFRSFLLAIPNGVAKSKEDAEARTSACLEKLKKSWDQIDPTHWTASCQQLTRIFNTDGAKSSPPSSAPTRPSIIARLMCNDTTAKSLVSLRRVLCQGEIRVLQSVVRKALHEKGRELDLVKEEVEALRKKVATMTPPAPKRGQLKRAVDRADQLDVENKQLKAACEEKEKEIALLHEQLSRLEDRLESTQKLAAMKGDGEDTEASELVQSLEQEIANAREGGQRLLARIEALEKEKTEAEAKKPRRNKKKEEEELRKLREENEDLKKEVTAAETQRVEKVAEGDKRHAELESAFRALKQELVDTKQHYDMILQQKEEMEDQIQVAERDRLGAEQRCRSVFAQVDDESETDEAGRTNSSAAKTLLPPTNEAERRAQALQAEVVSCTSRLTKQSRKLEEAETSAKRYHKVAEKLAHLLAQHNNLTVTGFVDNGLEEEELVREKAKFLVTSCAAAVEKEEKLEDKNAREAAAKEDERRIKAERAETRKRKNEERNKAAAAKAAAANGFQDPTAPTLPHEPAATTTPPHVYADVPPTPAAIIGPPPAKKRRIYAKKSKQQSATPALDTSSIEKPAKKPSAQTTATKKRARKPAQAAQPAQPDLMKMFGSFVQTAAGFLQNLKVEPVDSDAEVRKKVKRRRKSESLEEESETEDC